MREVHETLNETKPSGYTTVLKMLQIMTDKGLVQRDERQRAHVYEARVAREQTQKQLVTDLLERVFEGSATGLVMQALSAKKKSSERELADIRRMLDELEQKEK